MNGVIALVGSGEYLPVMNEIDRHLLSSVKTNGRTPRVVCMPTAAGQEGSKSTDRWLRMGQDHFQKLKTEVTPVRIIDRESANDPRWNTVLEKADLIYFSGGNPLYLYETLYNSLAWKAANKAWERGAIYAGCSAGAMILAQKIPNFRAAGLTSIEGFQVVSATFVVPHFDRIHGVWTAFFFAVRCQLKDNQYILGIDENTALVKFPDAGWQVMGQGKVHIITSKKQQDFAANQYIPHFS